MRMTMRIKVYPYKPGSKSATLLAQQLHEGGRPLRHVNSKYVPKPGDVVVNWGSSAVPAFGQTKVLNRDVRAAQCKLTTFRALHNNAVKAPPFWDKPGDIPADAYPVVCRTVLNGHSGQGIVIANSPDQLVPAQLYTKYIKKKDEFRVHVFHNNVFFVQRKARKLDVSTPNWEVRNLAGGFVFVEDDTALTRSRVANTAILALKALNLDFGGVDIVWNEQSGTAYVLEINTACGLEDRTAKKYAEVSMVSPVHLPPVTHPPASLAIDFIDGGSMTVVYSDRPSTIRYLLRDSYITNWRVVPVNNA